MVRRSQTEGAAMANQVQTAGTPKADEILRVGQELMQTNGYDGFSYRDIADRVGIKSASIHYHFPAKADLALAVARRYRTDFAAAVDDLAQQNSDELSQLVGFAGIFQSTLEDLDRVCLCGMLATESSSVPDEVNAEAEQFFTDQHKWISATITAGINKGTIREVERPEVFAQTFLSALEGAMIMARSMKRPQYLADVAAHLIAILRPASKPVP